MGAFIDVQCMCRDNIKNDTKTTNGAIQYIYWIVLAAVVEVHENILLWED